MTYSKQPTFSLKNMRIDYSSGPNFSYNCDVRTDKVYSGSMVRSDQA